jgi:predicted O-linked N-acetylglucosamine transferase (SPINDLY family)
MGPPGFAVRHSVSHLTAAGMSDWIAPSADAYIDTATHWARNPIALSRLRSGLRDRMAASPLCDGQAYAAAWQVVCRDIWRQWCEDARG